MRLFTDPPSLISYCDSNSCGRSCSTPRKVLFWQSHDLMTWTHCNRRARLVICISYSYWRRQEIVCKALFSIYLIIGIPLIHASNSYERIPTEKLYDMRIVNYAIGQRNAEANLLLSEQAAIRTSLLPRQSSSYSILLGRPISAKYISWTTALISLAQVYTYSAPGSQHISSALALGFWQCAITAAV